MENSGELHVEGRVTRSLRKRLASIDSDTQSRPSTPMLTKLDPINELNSPSRSVRRTRRNSTNTPAKTAAKTPSKAAQNRAALTVEVASEEGTPMRRTTRRHSTSISIIEEEKNTIKSVALQIDALPEENSPNQSNSLGRRVTRSTSKSPQQPAEEEKSTTNTHSGKKSSKTESPTRTKKCSDEEMSDVEIVNLEEIENQKKANKGNDNKPFQKLKKPVPEKDAREKTRNEIKKQPREKDNSFKKYLKSNLTAEFEFVEDELRTEEDNLIESEINTSKKQTSPETKTKDIYLDSDVDHLFDEHNLLIDLDEEGIEIETYRRDGKDSPADLANESGENETSTSNKRSPIVITDDVKLQRITPERIAHYANIKGTGKDSPKPSGNYPSRDAVKDATEIIKCVNFKETSDDTSIKSSYPTTPFVVKSKSYIERNLLREAYKKSCAKTLLENNDIAEPTEESELLDIAKSLIEDGDVEEEFVEVLKTPNKTTLNVIQSSTPLFLNASETQDEEQKEITNQIEYDKINSTEKLPKTNIKQAEALKQSEKEEPLKRTSLLEIQKQEAHKLLDKSNLDENLLAKELLKDTSKSHLRSANKSLKDLNEKQFEENSVANEKLEETPKTNLRSANKSLKDNEKQFSESLVAEERLKDTSKTHLHSANKSLKDLNEKQFEENSVGNEKLEEAPKTNLRSANKSLKDINEKQFSESLVADEEEVPKSNLRSANKSLKNVNEKQMDVNLLAEERLKDTSKSHLRSANKSLKDLNEKQFEENSVANEKLQDAPKTNLRSANKSLKDLNEKQFSESLVADEHLEENNSDNKTTPKEKQSFASSWTQVAVKTGGKIDEIFIEQPQRIITPPQLMNISNDDDVVGNNKSTEKIEPHKSPTFEPDDNKSCSEDEEDEDEDNGIEDDEPIEELAADEEPYNNCSLVLDEAMEADDDYQSGDSMDSEELREMKENEIPVDYESIGSGDTTEDEGEDDEDDDASFIVQDSETERAENSCFMYSDDDEHLLDGERKNKKNRHKYKRVLTIESSDSEQEEESGSSRPSFEKDNQLISKSNTTAKEHIIEATLDNLEFPNKEQEQLTLPNVQVSKIEKASTVEEKEKASMDSTEPRERPPKTVKRNSDFLITIVDSKVDCKENKKLIKSNISIESEDEEYESAEMLPLVINDDDDDEHNEDGDFKPNLDNKSGKSLNSSKLSETALKLQEDTSEENSDHQDENNQYNKLNLSQKHLIKKLHPSERLNKTIHELRGANEQEDNSSSDCEPFPVRVTRRATSLGGKNEQNKMLRNSLRKNRSKKLYPVATNETVLSSGEEGRQTTENEEVASSKRRSGFGKSTSKQLESNNESDVEENEDSDETKEIRNRKEMDEFHELTDEDNTKSKHVLSVSFGQTKDLNKSNAAQAEVAHSSSTIRVSVTKKNRGITTPEPLNTSQSSLQDDDDDGTDQEESSTTSNTKMAEFSSAEDEELLSKLSNDVTQSQKITNRRHSFVNTEVASAKKTIPTTETKASQLNLRKRNSSQIYLKDVDTSSDDFNPSQSLVENIKERKQELSEKNSAKRKRLSKSFCEGVGGGVGALDTTEHGEVRHLHKKLKQSNAQEKTSQNNDRPKTHIQKILGRCDEILEAANRAKLESKQNFNKCTVKLLKPKKVKKIVVEPVKDNEEKLEAENEILIQKELKRQEQAKVEIEKALHASANIMMKKPLSTKTKLVVSQDVSVAAAAAKGSSNPDSITSKPKKSKAPHLSILPSANDNRSHQHAPHKLKSSAGEVIEAPITEKKKKSHNEIKLSTGIVRVESLTPKKQRLQSGFRESPATPRSLGFKVRHILTIGQDTPPEIPAVLRKDGKRKRRKIEEPRNTLPKPQWTQSGIFMEEDLYPSIPVASTGSTQFMVSTLNDGRKRVKKSVTAADAGKGKSSSSNSALLFKKNALFRDNIPRETSHELLLRKQRQQFHSHY